MKEFVNGFVFGIIVIFVVAMILFASTRVVPQVTALKQDVPKELEEFLKRNTSRQDSDALVGELYMSPEMDIQWLDLVFTRLFLCLRSSASYKEMTLDRISKKMNLNLKKGLLVFVLNNLRGN
jgi:hypothetical protein